MTLILRTDTHELVRVADHRLGWWGVDREHDQLAAGEFMITPMEAFMIGAVVGVVLTLIGVWIGLQ